MRERESEGKEGRKENKKLAQEFLLHNAVKKAQYFMKIF